MIAIDWAAQALAWVLGFGVLLASLRLLWPLRGLPADRRPQTWRIALLLLGQVVSAVLLFLLLRTPPSGDAIHTLHLLTAHAPDTALPAPRADELWLRLPEAAPRTGVARTPDLATALRQHPGVRNLHIVGDGLEPRDRDAASGLHIAFERAPLAAGISDWWTPHFLRSGDTLRVQGRTHGATGARIELLDPAGIRIDQYVLQGDGGFSLQAIARSAGLADYQLRLRGADNTILGNVSMPVRVLPGSATQLLLRSGGPDPDLKFLRRWAADNGATLRASIDLGNGMQAGDPPAALDAHTLAGIDVLILDDRSWNGLGQATRNNIVNAVRDGLGLLLRASAPLADSEALGLQVRAATLSPTFKLPATDAAGSELPALSRPQLRIDNPLGHTVLRDDRGTPLTGWRTHGRGRIAVWLPVDSFRLALAGYADVHARLWADAINPAMRPRAPAPRDLPLQIYAGERSVFCDVGDGARVLQPGAFTPLRLAIDPRSGARRCAAFWPQRAGWHRLLEANTDTAFLVRAADADPVLRASRTQLATAALAALAARPAPISLAATSLPRWLLFLLWLAVTGGLWWFERGRFGRESKPAPRTNA